MTLRAKSEARLRQRRIQVGLIDMRGLSRTDRLITYIPRGCIPRSKASPTTRDNNLREMDDDGGSRWDDAAFAESKCFFSFLYPPV
jgi:hypothetical protein